MTGGGTGIGRMIAQGFVDNGARVYIASRREASKAAADIVRSSPHPKGRFVHVWLQPPSFVCVSLRSWGSVSSGTPHTTDTYSSTHPPIAFCQGLNADLSSEEEQKRLLQAVAKVKCEPWTHQLIDRPLAC